MCNTEMMKGIINLFQKNDNMTQLKKRGCTEGTKEEEGKIEEEIKKCKTKEDERIGGRNLINKA